MIFILSRQEREIVTRLRALGDETVEAGSLTAEVLTLKRQIVDLQIDKSRLQEDFEKRERELRHMVGLERQRQEAERKQHQIEVEYASQGASLKVREENLVADKKRFEEQLAFNTERFGTMEKYLKEMLADIMKRLPNVNVELSR